MREHTKILLRIPTELHRQVKTLGVTSGLSVNAMIVQACEHYVQTGDIPALEQRISQLEARFDKFAEMGAPSVTLDDIVRQLIQQWK